MADSGNRPPAYPCKTTVARELDCSESTVDAMVARGTLPRPIKDNKGFVRWCWADVEAALASLKAGADISEVDPFMQGARNATSGQEGSRATA